MNKLILFLSISLIITLNSCSKENTATLEVINQTSCLHNFYNGSNSNSSFLGAIGANQTKEFQIDLGSANNGFESYYADPQNCSSAFFGQSFSGIEFRKDQTKTILID